MASLRNKKGFETGLHCSQILSFKACKTYITAIFSFKTVQKHKSVMFY